jgi:protein SCO1/2
MRRCWAERLLLALLLAAGLAQAAASREQTLVRTSQAALGRGAGDWTLTDQRGRTFRLDELADRPLVVSFIYTGCFQVCPATTQFLKRAVAEARRALGPDSFRVVSIGFNQPFDTPDALAQFARQQGVDDPQWLFAAPREADVEALLQRFGLSVQRTPAGFDHLIQASIVDTRGTIVRQVYGDRFELPMFIDPLKQILAGEAAQQVTLEAIWTKVKLYCTVYDPYTGKYTLDYSLFFELFAGLTTLGAMGWFFVRQMRRGVPGR